MGDCLFVLLCNCLLSLWFTLRLLQKPTDKCALNAADHVDVAATRNKAQKVECARPTATHQDRQLQ